MTQSKQRVYYEAAVDPLQARLRIEITGETTPLFCTTFEEFLALYTCHPLSAITIAESVAFLAPRHLFQDQPFDDEYQSLLNTSCNQLPSVQWVINRLDNVSCMHEHMLDVPELGARLLMEARRIQRDSVHAQAHCAQEGFTAAEIATPAGLWFIKPPPSSHQFMLPSFCVSCSDWQPQDPFGQWVCLPWAEITTVRTEHRSCDNPSAQDLSLLQAETDYDFPAF